MKEQLQILVQTAVKSVFADLDCADVTVPEIQLELPRNPAHGDFSTNIALVLAKKIGQVPREFAAAIVAKLSASEFLRSAETAGPGFINFRIATSTFMEIVPRILAAGSDYGCANIGQGKRVQIEYVSANPTGPLHVGHGRGAAYGAVLANIFSAAGYVVEREYYVNDAGRQMDILAVSVLLRYLELGGSDVVLPENAYQGDYIIAMATQLRANEGDAYVVVPHPGAAPKEDLETALDELIAAYKFSLGADRYRSLHRFARDEILAGIKSDLSSFGVEFDNWFAESSLAEDGQIDDAVATLSDSGLVYTQDGAQWFKSTNYGDEKDRVVVRDNGSATYFASDIAYHQNKYARGFEHLINIWGADHHGYIARVKAAINAMDLDPERLEIVLVQFASLFRDGEKVAMSTRSGKFVTLAELVDEVGRDAARFFYITRRSDQHFDFDLDLAKSKKNENPIHYVQYAHARINGLFVRARAENRDIDIHFGCESLDQLIEEEDKQLAVALIRYNEVFIAAVENREPHLITTYLRELAADLHGYYHADRKIIVDDRALLNSRLALLSAVKQVLANGLGLLGVSAPETM